jgi:hypothetical protein
MRFARLTAMLALLQALGLSAVGVHAAEWVSYRDAYRAMVVFEKYGGAKNLIQNQLQVVTAEAGAGPEPLALTLTGQTTRLKLPLDSTGRAVLPLLKAAYDENAVLALNRNGAQFTLRPQLSIAVRADGDYDAAELRAACEQALGYLRYVDASARSRECSGVRFVFDKKNVAGARLRRGDGSSLALPVTEGAAFNGNADASYHIVIYRFVAGERVRVLTSTAPVAIAPLFD